MKLLYKEKSEFQLFGIYTMSTVQIRAILFLCGIVCFDSLMMVACGANHAGL
jgi:hypothetical protein